MVRTQVDKDRSRLVTNTFISSRNSRSIRLWQNDAHHSLTHRTAWPATRPPRLAVICDPPGVVGIKPGIVFDLLHPRSVGCPRRRLHFGLLSGLPPSRVSTARRRAEWAGIASGSRRTRPKKQRIASNNPSYQTFFVRLAGDEAFVTKWHQRIPKIRRWQFMRNASKNRRSSAFRGVHVSEPYERTEMTRAL